MSSHPENWTSQGLLAHIRRLHQHHPDHRFAFVLGAGASVSSGIPAGKELVDGWLRGTRHLLSPNYGERPPGGEVSLLVVHNISLPPEQFTGNFVEQFYQSARSCRPPLFCRDCRAANHKS